ncbi:MAG: ribosome maturation factor RimM [Gammaproteobacteria bacterium]|nr:ribosome maturation factor RimM [Gammaproteobacteria bacterium]
MSDKETRRVTLGQVVGIHGIHGSVKILSFTRPRDNIFSYPQWWLFHDNAWRPYTLCHGRSQGKGLVADLEGIGDRDAARALIGADIAVSRDQLPPLPAGEYYWFDLIGLEVCRDNGESLGHVVGLEETGANDVLVVRNEAGREQLIPYVADHYVLAVDVDAGTITVDWQPEAAAD